MQEPVGGGVQDEAELVGLGVAAGGAIGGKLALVPLDEVLGLAAGAIDGLVEMPGAGLERGDDIADIETLGRGLDAGHEAALLVPTLGTVAKGCEGAPLVLARERALDGHRISRLLRQGTENLVATEAKNVVNALAFAPLHHFVAAIVTVAAHQDSDCGPMVADALDDVLEDGPGFRAGRRLARA